MGGDKATAKGNTDGVTTNGQINEDSNENAAPPLLESQPPEYALHQTILLLLSRRDTGFGLIVIIPEIGSLEAPNNSKIEKGVPSALEKWAEEGHTVVELQLSTLTGKEFGSGLTKG